MANPIILLFDNGSLKPEASLKLRDLARNLSDVLSMQVEPVSLLHSCKIDPELLNGEPATIIRRRFKKAVNNKERKILCLPLFLGPSLAITDYLQELIQEALALDSEMQIKVAAPLSGWDVHKPDERLATVMKELIEECRANAKRSFKNIVLVDHGSPIKKMAILRNGIAEKVGTLLKGEGVNATVTACSMEKREGDAFSFNDPLLETIPDYLNLEAAEDLLVAMFFLMPGRHAGEGGDVETILSNLCQNQRIRSFCKTDLIASHPMIMDILADRVRSVLPEYSKT